MINSNTEQTIMQKRILGVWDISITQPGLGGLLIFVEELKMQQIIEKAEYIDLCFVGDVSQTLSMRKVCGTDRLFTPLSTEDCKGSPILTALLGLECIDLCYQCSSFENLQEFVLNSSYHYTLWPSVGEQGILNYDYGNTLFLKKFFKDYSFIPYLSCREELARWAMGFLQSYVFPSMPVVIHLKNNPNEENCSNANFDEWFSFFRACNLHYDVKFILIGNEEIDKRIHNLPNTILARDFGSNLSRDLALIQTACIFMGMASGPCQMALFSDVPYVIYKNPDHHAKEMQLEMGREDQFPFASSLQKVLRVFETQENLMSVFDFLYTNVKRSDWGRKKVGIKIH